MAAGWFGRWWRARTIKRQAIDEASWGNTVTRLSFLRTLSAADLNRLREMTALFLDRKVVSGAGGLKITREIQLIIAAQASLLVLNLDLDFYDDWVEVIVYPDEFVADHEYMSDDGVLHRVRAPLSGEAWEQGPVILSWNAAQSFDGADGYTVVLHEFAHKIDMRNGRANGFPPLHDGMDRLEWTRVFGSAYADFSERVDRRDDVGIDPYAAEHPAEFFAVLSETFFEKPEVVHAVYPDVYRLLADFYRQDPLTRGEA